MQLSLQITRVFPFQTRGFRILRGGDTHPRLRNYQVRHKPATTQYRTCWTSISDYRDLVIADGPRLQAFAQANNHVMIKYANPSDRERNVCGISTTEASERFFENAVDAIVQRTNGPAALLYRNIARQNSLAARLEMLVFCFEFKVIMINLSHLKVLPKVDDPQNSQPLMQTLASENRIDSLFCTRHQYGYAASAEGQ